MKQLYARLLKVLCLIAFLTLCHGFSFAQTLTLGTVDAGPYTPGSSIAVPFTTSGNCIKPDNVFELYISSIPGGTPDTKIGSYNGFYATFVNGTIPTGLVHGSYNLAIKSTRDPATSSTSSINIIAGTPVEAKLISSLPLINNNYPDVFGNCSGNGTTYNFTNSSTSGATVMATVFNEINQTGAGSLTFNASQSASFNAAKVNYTIFVKAVSNGVEGTRAYQLINNRLTTNFGTTSGDPVCLTNGQGVLMYTILPAAIQNNYPGNLYTVDWGDGSFSQYTLCDLLLSNGQLSHPYLRSSCGTTSGGQINSFPVNAQASSNICGSLGSPLTSYAKVVTQPVNNFTGPQSACLNVPISFTNTSDPGQDASNPNCQNSNALYTWIIDIGTPTEVQFNNYALSTPFTYPFTTPGHHTITLRFESQSSTVCSATDVTKDVCVLAPPRPNFSLAANTICSADVVTPTDLSVTDQSCNSIPANNAYTWSVTGPGGISYLNGTTASYQQPQIKFTTPGIYTLTLSIGTESCGNVSTSQTITVNTTPTVTLSPDKQFCGTNQVLTFANNPGATQTIFTGTTTDQPNTYSWTVTGGNYSYQNGTSASSKYPQILFTDFAAYTVTARQTNNCGSNDDSQNITFLQSPTVDAGRDQTICPANVVTLAGTISNPQPQSFQWVGGNGTFSPGRTSLNATYTPTSAEVDAGQVRLTLTAITGYPPPCDQLSDEVIITINPRNKVANASDQTVCTGDTFTYQPMGQVDGSTVNWTSTATSNISRNLTSGSGGFSDVLTNADPTHDGTVTYTITPVNNGCPGTPSTFTVTVKPRPAVTVNPAATTICSGQPVNIGLSSILPGTAFKWTSTHTPGISGNSNQTATNTTGITETLYNTSATTPGSVTYTITPVGPAPTNCEGTPVTVTITVQPLPTPPNASPDDAICSTSSYLLRGNDPGTSSGNWSIVSGQTGVTFANATQFNTIVNGLQPGQLYTFRWTITGASECAVFSDDVNINDLSDLTNNISSANPTICYGQAVTINGDQPTGGNLSYSYIWQSSADNATWTTVQGENQQYLSVTLNSTTYFRRIVISGPCEKTSNSVQIVVQPQIASNSIIANQTICYNTTPTALTGSTPTGGDGNYLYQWQKSEDNGATWRAIANANGQDYQPQGLLTVTTQFKRVVSTALCNGTQENNSNVVTITVAPRNTNYITSGPSQPICTGTTFTYHITARDANTSFTYVSSASASIGGNSASGRGDIHDPLVNNDPVNNGTVTYTITPFNNDCPGTPFTLTITVTPIPQIILTNTGKQICSGNPTGIKFNTNIPGALVKWTFDPVAGISGMNNQFPVIATRIDDVLFSTLTTPATVVYHLTPISANGCVGPTVDATVTVLPVPVTANAGADEAICNSSTYTLNGNNPLPSTGNWTLTSGQNGVGFADASRYNTPVSGLVAGQQYIFRWTITSTGACATSTDDVTIADLSLLSNNISFPAPAVCYGQTISVIGDQPTGGNGNYAYSWESSADNANWATIRGASSINYTFTATESIYFRRIVTSGPCSSISKPVYIIVQQPISENTIGSNQEVCYNNTPKLFTGSTPAGADGKYYYQWQSSTDNGANWTNISGANGINYQINSLTLTTQFRRVVTSLLCTGPQQSTSNVITVNVNPLVDPTYTFTGDLGCIPYVLNAKNIKATAAPGNATYSWYADGVQFGSGLTFPGYTITEDNKQVVIKLIVTSKFGCPDASFTHTFSTIKEVKASFTQDQNKGCGPLTVTFNNTSNPKDQATYTWNFGNGQTSTLVNPLPVTFQPRSDGKDTTFTITLKALTTCGIRTFTSTVLVRPKPISIFTPDRTIGCSPFTVNFNNTSPGINNTYTFDFGDGQTLVMHDNQNVLHTYISATAKTFTVKMTAENECGKSVTQYNLRISPKSVLPQLVINADQKVGCAPWTVQFYNNTKGGNYFTYDFGDGTTQATQSAPEVVTHTFLKSGVFNIKLTATNGCADTSTYQSVTVYPQPVANFTSDVQTGCIRQNVNFKNLTPGTGNTYFWDFGDGGTATATNPQHVFAARNTPYTITLIAKNGLSCSDTMVMKNYITITIPPKAAFAVKPDSVIAYPYHNFDFTDRSINTPLLWQWSFGDGASSSKQNPGHTYRDTGVYKVRLIVYNLQGCGDTIVHKVQITGVPGQLFVPNAFMPTSKYDEVTTFKIKGSGLKTWRMRVFNKWGQVIWETTKLTERGEPAEGWDGMMGGAPAPQGIYVWEISGTYMNGKEWTGMSYNHGPPSRQGIIHLIR